MKTITDFNKAKSLLTREVPAGYPAPVRIKGKTARKADGTEEIVKQIIADVRLRGDEALHYYTEKLDKIKLSTFNSLYAGSFLGLIVSNMSGSTCSMVIFV